MSTKQEISRPAATYATVLRFVPSAWAKILYFQQCGDTEIAGYCVTGTADPLLVTDFRLVKQECTGASFDLDPEDGAEFLEQMTDEGFMPWQCQRILAHTHPGNSPNPSATDEKNFKRVFTSPDWAIMLIVADNGAIYCRLKFNVGPGGTQMLKVEVDFSQEFPAANHEAWKEEYKAKVVEHKFRMTGKEGTASRGADSFPVNGYEDPNDPLWWNGEHERWSTQQAEFDRQIAEADTGYSPVDEIDCHWDANGDVAYWNDENGVWFYYDPINGKWYSENLDGDDGDEVVEVTPPNEHWVIQVVLWANRYADERDLALEEAS
ncbi:MAG: hypothetical protein DRJ03_19500 [Chloroflexi bacterium]|nr:MAG: hypothetical protein DRJ03_19500 [Chloroflexota bacterium]